MTRRLIILASLLIGLGLTSRVEAASLYLSPSSGTYTVGQTVTVTAYVNTAGQAINASEGTITWSTATLQFVSLSSSSSIFKYWPIDPVVTGSSTIMFSGGLPSPGYTGTSGRIIRITFTAKAAGTATVSVQGGKILANDGQGTDIYSGHGNATYTVKTSSPSSGPTTPSVPTRPTPTISSTTHAIQTNWYTAPEAIMRWTQPSGAIGFSYQLSREALTVPDEVSEGTATTATAVLSVDGTWYYHVRAQYSSGWSATAHYALHLDRVAPTEAKLEYAAGTGATGYGQLFASAQDGTSGVARYSYVIDGGTARDGLATYDVPALIPGRHQATVTISDAAGNSVTAQTTWEMTGYAVPTITSVSSPLVLLDPLVVRGTANASDTITIYVNGQAVGQVIVAPETDVPAGTTARFPWVLTTDRLFRPGMYSVTATATSATGQLSAPTPAHLVRVVGHAIMFNGRPVALWSVLTPVGVLFLSLLVLVILVMTRLVLAVWLMHRHERDAEDDLEMLRTVNRRQDITKPQLDQAIDQIEEDLRGTTKPVRTRRRSAKRAR